MARAAAGIELSAAERRELESLARARQTRQGVARRARIVLAAAPQGKAHPGLARQAPTLARPLYADQRLMDQPGRAVLRPDHGQTDQTRYPSLDTGTRGRHPSVHQSPQRRSQTLPMDEVRRRYPGQHPAVLRQNIADQPNFGISTLALSPGQPVRLPTGHHAAMTQCVRRSLETVSDVEDKPIAGRARGFGCG